MKHVYRNVVQINMVYLYKLFFFKINSTFYIYKIFIIKKINEKII